MQALVFLAPIFSLVAFVAFVWLVIVAFKRHVWWGVGVLLLSPITAVIFAIKYWQESKKPFLIYMGSFAAGCAIVLTMFTQMGGFEMLGMAKRMQQGEVDEAETVAFIEKTMDRMEHSGLLDVQEQKDLQEMRRAFQEVQDQATATVAKKEPAPAPTPTPESSRPTPTSQTRPSSLTVVADQGFQAPSKAGQPPKTPVPLRNVDEFKGQFLSVVTKDGYEYEGRLAKIGPAELRFDRQLPGGIFSIVVKRADIRSLHVSRR